MGLTISPLSILLDAVDNAILVSLRDDRHSTECFTTVWFMKNSGQIPLKFPVPGQENE